MRYILMYDFLTELGGLEKLMATHAKFLQEEGHEVLLLFGVIKPEMLEHFKGLPIQAYGESIPKNLIGLNKLHSIIKPEDIIISYSFPVNWTVRMFNNKKIQYLNHFPQFLYLPFKDKIVWANTPMRKLAAFVSICGGWLIRMIDKSLMKKNSLVFYNSYFTKTRLKNIYNMEGTVSYPSVSEDFKPTLANFKHRYIFASGRVIPDKRVDWLIEAFSFIEDKSLKLIIAGQVEENYKEDLMDKAKKLGVADRVKFLGIVSREKLIKLITMAEVYVFPTPQEDFGLTPAEAISCGTPVVIWGDNGGPTEQITHGVNGCLARPYSTTDYAFQIQKAIKTSWNTARILVSAQKFSSKEVKKGFMEAINDKLHNNRI